MKRVAALLALLIASVALVACGGSSDNSSSATTTTEESAGATGSSLEFEADPSGQLAYTTTKATAKAGKVTIDFTNPQGLPHDVKIESSSGEDLGGTDTVAEGSDSATVDLKPGTYHFYCSVPGHREAGMEGTLTVK